MVDVGAGHAAVLLPEVLAALNIRAGGTYLDATFGRGGHAGAILEKLMADGRLLCLDRDTAAVAEARARWGEDPRVRIFLAPFSKLAACADAVEPGLKFDGILFDLGVSSPQLDDPARGFSFMRDGPLDMRMTQGEGMSAADVVNGASEAELIRIFREFGEERDAPQASSRAIVADRKIRAVRAAPRQLAEMIGAGRSARASVQQASGDPRQVSGAAHLRECRARGARRRRLRCGARARLAPGGRLAVISFHSLEDRMVKQFMRRHANPDPVYAGLPDMPAHARAKLKLVGKSVEPASEETERNPRARSARLRASQSASSQGIAA